MATIFGNVAVLTALLVYFGWVRSEVHSRLLGIDESVLGMTTREYVLRSVRSVLVLLLVVSVAGLIWLLFDQILMGRWHGRGATASGARRVVRLLPAALIVLPGAAWALGFVWPATMFVAFPLSVAAGLLLVLYGLHLRQILTDTQPLPSGRETLLRAFTGVIVGIALFSSAANYATVEGTRLADGFAEAVPDLPAVVIYSKERLQIDAPGSIEDDLSGVRGAYPYRYRGLRLMEHTGGNYFLVTDAWNPQTGVVLMLADSTPMRLEFTFGDR